MADIAGIIEGASEGAGMGFRFLKHIERTKVLIHVVDVSGSEGRDPIEDFDKINAELAAYSESLLRKPMLVAANKIDLLPNDDDETLDRFTDYVESKGYKVFPLSAPISIGTEELLKAALEALARAEEEPDEEVEIFDFEKEDNDPDYRTIYVDEEDGVFVLSGKQLMKIFRSTNFYDMGSLRYLYKYIEKSGVIDQLKEMGLEEGDTIRIDNFEFEYVDEF
jgi:GTP-binding protein